MRIISGALKGKSINFLKNSTTRPLKDNVRENIFNIINHSNLISINLKNSKVLDAYSGVGSFGVECLSRGAKQVTFVEKDQNASKILRENLMLLSITERATVFKNTIEKFLEYKKKEKYSIFFFDPPFSNNTFIQNLIFIKKNRMYESNHIIILHRERKSNDNLKDYIDTIFTKQYGRSKIIFGFFTK